VVDTGILATHLDFEGRVEPGHTVIDDGLGSSDCNGHGTHVAGTIGGRHWGVAKDVTLVPVRVLGCGGSGMLSGVIAGLDWVASQGVAPSVVNLSLSTGRSAAFNATVAALVAQGITVVAAAGNADTDACSRSPASEPGVLTVAASTAADTRAGFSNHGPCVALYAPGVGVTSAWHTAPDAAVALSGTSMAAPLLYALAPGAPQPWSVAVTALAPLQPERLADGRLRARLSAKVQAYDGDRWTDVGPGARVSGIFSPGGPAACTTDASGQCVLNRCATALDAQAGSFTVLSIRAEGMLGNPTLGVGSITHAWLAVAVAAGN
jgi:subtilisin family serine protease